MWKFDDPAYVPASREEYQIELQRLKESVKESGLIPEEIKEFLFSHLESGDLFLERKKIKKRPEQHFYTASIGWEQWVVRNDNLRLLEVLSAAALAVTTFAVVSASAPAVLAVTLVLGCVALADRLQRKGVSLKEDDYKILMSLKAAGPTSPAELAERLGELHIFGAELWSVDETIAALERLKAVRVGDGSVEALVVEASDGMWSVNGL